MSGSDISSGTGLRGPAARRWRLLILAAEPLLQVGLDRRPAQVRVDVRIAFMAERLANLLDAGRSGRELERALDNIGGLHGKSFSLPS